MLIGSKAAKHWFPDFRDPQDTDYMLQDERVEGSDSKACWAFDKIIAKYQTNIAPPDLLLTLKLSHIYWDSHWFDKTTHDIGFLQSKGCEVDEEAYSWLYQNWEEIKGKKRAYLDKSNDEFFKDGVKRKYIHDNIHKSVAYYNEPLYERIKADSSKAMCSKNMFFNLSKEDQLKCSREEAYVTALERFLIPSDFKAGAYIAYRKSLKLLITSMTRGWFARFLAENFVDLKQKTDYPWVDKFKQNIKNYEPL